MIGLQQFGCVFEDWIGLVLQLILSFLQFFKKRIGKIFFRICHEVFLFVRQFCQFLSHLSHGVPQFRQLAGGDFSILLCDVLLQFFNGLLNVCLACFLCFSDCLESCLQVFKSLLY